MTTETEIQTLLARDYQIRETIYNSLPIEKRRELQLEIKVFEKLLRKTRRRPDAGGK